MEGKLVSLLVLLGLGVLVTSQNPIDCKFEWTSWTVCDPGPCGLRRDKQTRIAKIISAPQFGGKACPFPVGAQLGQYSVQNYDPSSQPTGIIQTRSCTPTLPCYEPDYCLPGQKQCTRPHKCVHESLNCNGYFDCPGATAGAKEIPNVREIERGVSRINGTQVAGKVLEDSYHGTCKTVNRGGAAYRMPYNMDSYDSVSHSDQGWKTQRFSTASKLAVGGGLAGGGVIKGVLATLGFNFLYSKQTKKQSTFYKSEATFLVDDIHRRSASELEVSASLESEVKRLPPFLDYERFLNFIAVFGTDYIVSTVRGGRIQTLVQEFSCSETIAQEYGATVDATTASVKTIPSPFVGISFNYGHSSSSHGYDRSTQAMSTGGDSSLLVTVTEENVEKWVQTLDGHPSSLFETTGSYRFKASPIYSLLESKNLQIHNKSLVKEAMMEGWRLYINLFDPAKVCSTCPANQQLTLATDGGSFSGKYECVCLPDEPITCGGSTLNRHHGNYLPLTGFGISANLLIAWVVQRA